MSTPPIDLTAVTNQRSPFDGIKRTTDDGREYWSARDLMPLLGYPTWQHFTPAISRAILAAEAQGYDRHDLFTVDLEKSGGRPREDFQMPRFACYLVAMNGDPRKPEVAAAQGYFAIQTRVAETQQPAPAELSRMDILRLAIDAEQENQALKAEVLAAAPKVTYVDQFVADTDLLKVRAVAARLGIGETALRTLLLDKKWIYKETESRWSDAKQAREERARYSAYADKRAYFQPVMTHEAPRFKGETMHTLKITPDGASAIARLVNHGQTFIALNGTGA